MTSTQIKCFLTVAKTLSFTEAAKALYMAQPALSKQIAAFEKELDMQLFDRTRRSVKLTTQGAVMYEELSALQRRMEVLMDMVRAIGKVQGTKLNVGVVMDDLACKELPVIVYEFSRCMPEVDLNVQIQNTATLRQGLLDGTFDVIIALDFEVDDLEGIIRSRLALRQLEFVIGKKNRLAQSGEPITFENLSKEAYIGVVDDNYELVHQWFGEKSQKLGYTPSEVLYAPNIATQRMWLGAGRGAGLIDLKNTPWLKDVVKVIDLPFGSLDWLCAVWMEDNKNPLIRYFVETAGDIMN